MNSSSRFAENSYSALSSCRLQYVVIIIGIVSMYAKIISLDMWRIFCFYFLNDERRWTLRIFLVVNIKDEWNFRVSARFYTWKILPSSSQRVTMDFTEYNKFRKWKKRWRNDKSNKFSVFLSSFPAINHSLIASKTFMIFEFTTHFPMSHDIRSISLNISVNYENF